MLAYMDLFCYLCIAIRNKSTTIKKNKDYDDT